MPSRHGRLFDETLALKLSVFSLSLYLFMPPEGPRNLYTAGVRKADDVNLFELSGVRGTGDDPDDATIDLLGKLGAV